jgi:CheY-like chemotaxis protein
MPAQTLRVLVVDDQETTCRQIKEHFETWEYADNRLIVETETEFGVGLQTLEERRFDLVVLDVYQGQQIEGGEEAGKRAFEEIKARRFIPVIFYTALPASVQDLAGPLVKVAEKAGEAFASLDQAVKGYLDTPLMRINRALTQHVEETVRSYMWQFATQHWTELADSGDDAALAYLICRRVASSLDITGAERLAAGLTQATQAPVRPPSVEQVVHALRYYLMPPSGPPTDYRTGDILIRTGTPAASESPAKPDTYWIILTPWCDLTFQRDNTRNAEYVLLARCLPLDTFEEHREWIAQANPSNTRTKKLQNLAGTPNRRPDNRQEGRYYFLPGIFELPDLLVDFQQTLTAPYGDMGNYQKIATLDSPFAESVISWFVRFISRVGTPNLDIDAVLQSIRRRGTSPQTT